MSDTKQRCLEIINQNQDSWEDFKDGDSGALTHLIGQVMQLTGGEEDPNEVADTFRSLRTNTDGTSDS